VAFGVCSVMLSCVVIENEGNIVCIMYLFHCANIDRNDLKIPWDVTPEVGVHIYA